MAKKAEKLVELLKPLHDLGWKYRVFTKMETEVHIPNSRQHLILDGDYHDGFIRMMLGYRLLIPDEEYNKELNSLVGRIMSMTKQEVEDLLWCYSKEAQYDISVPNKTKLPNRRKKNAKK